MKGRVIVFEGVDASGKATQSQLLHDRMKQEGFRVELIAFPRYSEFFGSIVGRYLRGDFGKKEDLPDEFIALLFSIDRYELKKKIENGLNGGTNYIFDRYFTSNYGFSTARKENEKERLELLNWLKKLESRMPQPDLVLFLDMPLEAIGILMLGEDRKKKEPYRKGLDKDIHEGDMAYLDRVRRFFLELSKKEKKWAKIDCTKFEEHKMKIRTKEEIHEQIWKKVKPILG